MRENEIAFLDLIKQGIYKVYKNGKIYKCKIKRNQYDEYKKCNFILQNIKTIKGYIKFTFCYQGKIMDMLISRAIWIYFNGNIPKNLEINHKNGIKDDNRLSNLELITHKENIIHAYKNGLNYHGFSENSRNHKLNNKDVLKIRKLLKKSIFQYEIAKIFNVSCSTISRISCKKCWT